jgi:hypothetical protein
LGSWDAVVQLLINATGLKTQPAHPSHCSLPAPCQLPLLPTPLIYHQEGIPLQETSCDYVQLLSFLTKSPKRSSESTFPQTPVHVLGSICLITLLQKRVIKAYSTRVANIGWWMRNHFRP